MDELEQSVAINQKLKEDNKFVAMQKIKCTDCIKIFMNDSDSDDFSKLKRSDKF